MAHASEMRLAQRSMASGKLPAVLMIVLGAIAFFLPTAAGIGVAVLFGIIVLIAGGSYGGSAFAARGTTAFVWRALVSVAFVLTGLSLIVQPGMGLVTLTLLLALAFLIEGLAEVGAFFATRSYPGSGFLLINAVFSLVLAFLIWRNWPSSSAWAIGTIVGINLISTGITRLFVAPLVTR